MKRKLSVLLLCVAQLNASAFILQDGVSTILYKPSIKAGVFDKTFGSGTGKVTTAIGSSHDYLYALAIQTDGKIVAGGYSDNGSNNDFALARYTTSGDLDTTFGSGTGKVTTAISSNDDIINALAVQADGKIVAGGKSYNGSNYDFAVARYTTSGDLDTTFGSGTGKVTTAISSNDDIINALAVQADGKIVAGGYNYNGSDYDFALVRYTASGVLDTTFGSGTGKVTTAIGSGSDVANALAIQADGKIVVGGYSDNGSNNDFALVRYTTSGDLDTTFGSGTGKVTTAIGSDADLANALAVQTDGKIVVGGYSYNGSYYDFAVARYTTDVDPLIQSASLFVNGRGGLVR